MFYTQTATPRTPALVIYLIDAIRFMNMPCGSTTKIEVASKALREMLQEMVRRSMRDGSVHPLYKVAIFAYHTKVEDMLDGICDLPDLIKHGIPPISANGETDTTAGFMAVETLLQNHLRKFQDCPAPLICHLSDGVVMGRHPASVVQRIKAMAVNDGPVLIENVYAADDMFRSPVEDWSQWSGVLKRRQLTNGYAKFLFHLSSPLPESYRQNINNYGYDVRKEAAFFFPATQTDLMRLAFPISTVTQLK